MTHVKKRTAAAVCLSLFMAGSAAAAVNNPHVTPPSDQPDGSWTSISGKVTDTQPGAFTLDYGKGKVTVEMDGWVWYGKNYQQIKGDKVTVVGKIDDDFFEQAKIEASSVYDQKLGSFFYANAADEEGSSNLVDYWVHPVVVGETVVQGTVTSVGGHTFTVDDGPRRVTINVDQLPSNPLDDTGFQQIDKGDYVSVAGDMDRDFWGFKRLDADSVITLVSN
ncbi:hypothetical protein [Dyella sp.]|jgi:uncharacterized protein YdeI (BOF family)|uniref:hypothetical protein n=1 Tax=Dyella sp. TaxID=1869338 RepID=UPI002D7A0A7E|nr:hypothetical protein [Dyella sp.]HET6432910.1 hypothetical protein [Dyella sp.]